MRETEPVKWVRGLADERGVGCRDWPWSTNAKGYGWIRWEGRMTKVGHVILELSGRPRPSLQHFQLHSCDRPTCAAPWHLRWGTAAEQTADAVARNRRGKGEAWHSSKLTTADVIAIRAASGRTLQSLAEQFGVDRSVVGKIRRGLFWKHIE